MLEGHKTFSDLDYQESKDKVKEIQNLSKKIYRPYKVLTPFQIIKSFFEKSLSYKSCNSLYSSKSICIPAYS